MSSITFNQGTSRQKWPKVSEIWQKVSENPKVPKEASLFQKSLPAPLSEEPLFQEEPSASNLTYSSTVPVPPKCGSSKSILKKTTAKPITKEAEVQLLYLVNNNKDFTNHTTLNNPPFVPRSERNESEPKNTNSQPLGGSVNDEASNFSYTYTPQIQRPDQPTSEFPQRLRNLSNSYTATQGSSNNDGINVATEKQAVSSSLNSSHAQRFLKSAILTKENLQAHNCSQTISTGSRNSNPMPKEVAAQLRGYGQSPSDTFRAPYTNVPIEDGDLSAPQQSWTKPRPVGPYDLTPVFSVNDVLNGPVSATKSNPNHPTFIQVSQQHNALATLRDIQTNNAPHPKPPRETRTEAQSAYVHYPPTNYQLPSSGKKSADHETAYNSAIQQGHTHSPKIENIRRQERNQGNLAGHTVNGTRLTLAHQEPPLNPNYLRYLFNKNNNK